MENKALVGQVHGAFFAVEAVVVPGLSFIGHHTGAFTKPSDGVLASSTLLGHKVLVAIHAVILVLHSGETLPSQLLRAGNTHKALGMPGLILVSDSSRCDGLVALHAMLGKFGLVASCAVEVLPFREEASSPDDLLAVAAGEAVFVPDDPLVLHVLISCHDRLEAALALEGVLPRGALVAQDLVVLGHKGLTGQRVKALGTAKAGFVPVAVLVVHLLGVRTDGLAAFHTGVGAELVKALQAAVVAILFHVLLPLQGVSAVVAVKLLSHGTHLVPGGTCQSFTTLKPHTFKPLILPKPSSSLVTFIVLEHDSLRVSRHPDDEIIHGSPMNMEVPEYDEYGVSQWRCSPLYHSYSTGSRVFLTL